MKKTVLLSMTALLLGSDSFAATLADLNTSIAHKMKTKISQHQGNLLTLTTTLYGGRDLHTHPRPFKF